MTCRSLVIVDYSGTLSCAAALFALPHRLEGELRASGLAARGVKDGASLFARVVRPTWQEATTTALGYGGAIVAALGGEDGDGEELRRAAGTFVGRYLAASTIEEAWLPLLTEPARRPGLFLLVATDHYAEATGAILGHLAALGLAGAAVRDWGRKGGPPLAVANSADLGFPKESEGFWEACRSFLPLGGVRRIVVVDDFGANEAYADPRDVPRRRRAVGEAVGRVFGLRPEIVFFRLPSPPWEGDVVAGAVSASVAEVLGLLKEV
ncbi:MAG TPA: hypothetical protein PLN44_02705 [Syntrophales bacterium]|nr:hypothetical protein [Syntrophales bacterium]HPQ05759.1 hypothetical protein [Syntrophales bacterium]